MTADLSASAYLVDAVALADATAELTHDGAGLWSGMSEEIGTDTFPGRDGGSITDGVFRPYTLSTMYTLRGANREAAWAAVVALRRRCKPGRTVTLTRTMPDPDGTDANVPHTTVARRLTDRPGWLAKRGLTLDIDWWVTEAWHGAELTIPASGTQDVAGDTRTNRITIDLPAGPARYVTNNTNGHWLLFFAVVPAGGVVIDVEAQTAIANTGSVDMSEHLSWAKTHPMQLEAGPNSLAVTAGTASINYQPAYL